MWFYAEDRRDTCRVRGRVRGRVRVRVRVRVRGRVRVRVRVRVGVRGRVRVRVRVGRFSGCDVSQISTAERHGTITTHLHHRPLLHYP